MGFMILSNSTVKLIVAQPCHMAKQNFVSIGYGNGIMPTVECQVIN